MSPPSSVFAMLQENVRKPRFCKSLSLGETWKSKSMRIIPEEFLRSTLGAIKHRVVFSVSWGNSWQLWLQQDKNGGLVMEKEDWDEFVDDNLLSPKDVLFFTHEDTMFIQVRIYKQDLHIFKEIVSVPLEAEPKESELLNTKPQTSHEETTPVFASASSSAASASGATQGYAPVLNVKNPEQYLFNPNNPYFVKTLTKKIDVLYVSHPVIEKYGLNFGPHKSPMYYIIRDQKHDAFTKIYGRNPCFSHWAALCKKYNLKQGDSVVCELERTGGVVTAVRVHLGNE
ncbi:unnamed protein product [Eruca vesicaria subsp. sativa]|uniref:TF-B3 domain-containing protein n=1 Tax=Eruca vesicaria subsp. sativa TaxID=29727 RepID=A0ABC8KVU6_ERUVS|nr:unnamed protein product [Eruca vesicaria subsp. sativa]